MPRVHPGVLIGVSIWRLLIVASAFTGFWLYYGGHLPNLTFLTQLGNLFTSIVYLVLLLYPLFTGGRRHEPASSWIRGATTVLMTLVGGTYLTMMSGSLTHPRDLLTHAVTPLLVLVDWAAVGRGQQRTRWWHPLTWPVFPLLYIVCYVTAGWDNYPFLDPRDGGFAGVVVGFLVGLIVVGYVLYGLAALVGAIRRSVAPDAPGGTAPPGHHPPHPGGGPQRFGPPPSGSPQPDPPQFGSPRSGPSQYGPPPGPAGAPPRPPGDPRLPAGGLPPFAGGGGPSRPPQDGRPPFTPVTGSPWPPSGGRPRPGQPGGTPPQPGPPPPSHGGSPLPPR
ncbi:hypothetical protein FHR81_001226 [Actinoalloteichus hoggarensis]|uniref:Uncharacterized protein n=1 Tax=Actinoalloteichus hoggarensis TaxID=1470176 RepID=A0A221VZL5_9PSEU|nr:Pr6Pr family membrane protein [Actinoalloteichus hoggarensis]ASO18960.1 hypothetical protein AHOG_06550 [Actinoalloteichus hoggarensis]MBB5920196.1 hypothetical protein [Actinoalloteichus hoggarensis]